MSAEEDSSLGSNQNISDAMQRKARRQFLVSEELFKYQVELQPIVVPASWRTRSTTKGWYLEKEEQERFLPSGHSFSGYLSYAGIISKTAEDDQSGYRVSNAAESPV